MHYTGYTNFAPAMQRLQTGNELKTLLSSEFPLSFMQSL
jgi:hypothetical protein